MEWGVISCFSEDEGENGPCVEQPFRRDPHHGRTGDMAMDRKASKIRRDGKKELEGTVK